MQIRFVALAFIFASTPTWAIYKCTVNGAVAFQEQPCADARTQAQIRTQYEAEKLGSEPAVKSATLEEKASALETERLRHETEYALRDKRAQLTNFRAQCDAEVRAIAIFSREHPHGATRSLPIEARFSAWFAPCGLQKSWCHELAFKNRDGASAV